MAIKNKASFGALTIHPSLLVELRQNVDVLRGLLSYFETKWEIKIFEPLHILHAVRYSGGDEQKCPL